MRYRDHHDDAALRKYASALNLRAQAANVRGTLRLADLRGVILESGGRCRWCGASVLGAEFEIDHVLSLSRGGRNTPDNLALTCPDCNRQKSDKHPARYAAEILARGLSRTTFLSRVIEQYGDADPGAQMGMFDAPPPPSAPVVGLDDDEKQDETPPPPYVWE